MHLFVIIACYAAAALALVTVAGIGASMLTSPTETASSGAQPPKLARWADRNPGEQQATDAPRAGAAFRYGPEVNHGRGDAPVNHAAQALKEARSGSTSAPVRPDAQSRRQRSLTGDGPWTTAHGRAAIDASAPVRAAIVNADPRRRGQASEIDGLAGLQHDAILRVPVISSQVSFDPNVGSARFRWNDDRQRRIEQEGDERPFPREKNMKRVFIAAVSATAIFAGGRLWPRRSGSDLPTLSSSRQNSAS